MASPSKESETELLDRSQRRAFRALTLAATAGTISFQVIAGNFLALFVNRYGFSPFLIGTLFLTIQAPAILQIWGSRYVDRHGARTFLLYCYMLSPLTVLPLILAPQIGAWAGKGTGTVAIFAGATGFMFLNAVTTAGWLMLLRSNLPRDQIAGLLGRMNRISMFCGLATTLAFSLFLGNDPHIWQFQAVFVAAAMLMGLRALRLARVKDMEPSPHAKPAPLHKDLRAILSDAPFRSILIYTAINFMAGGLVGPFRPLFITTLGFSERVAAIITVPLNMGAYGLGWPVWGALADRYGSRGVYVLAGIGVTLSFLCNAIPCGHGPMAAALLAFSMFLCAFSWGGFDAGNMRRLYTMTTTRPLSLYLVVYTLVLSVSGSLGAFLGGALIKGLRTFTTQAGDVGFAQGLDYRVLFLIAAILFIIALGYSRRMLAMQEMSADRLVVHLRLRVQRWLLSGLPGDLFRWIWPDEEPPDGKR